MERGELIIQRSEWMDLLRELESAVVVRDEADLGFAEEDCVEEVVIRAEQQ